MKRKTQHQPKHDFSGAEMSPQWQSQSSIASSSGLERAESPSGAPPPPSCDECHIDFKKEVVFVKWSASGSYNGMSNVKTAGGGWTPDYWIPVKSKNGANVDKSGNVTFGKTGQTITLSCKVKRCPNCTGSFTLHIVRVQVFHKGKDITDQTKTVEVGNYIRLDAKVTPEALTPPSEAFLWEISDNVLKDYISDAASRPVVHLTKRDRRNTTTGFHWLDGGVKTCWVSVKIGGIAFNPLCFFDVQRPSLRIIGDSVPGYPSAVAASLPKAWDWTVADVKFKRVDVRGVKGKLCWTQIFPSDLTEWSVGGIHLGQYPKGRYTNLLDSEFEYGGAGPISDIPVVVFVDNPMDLVSTHWYVYMYTMYRSRVPDSRWVPLRRIYWEVGGWATGTPNIPHQNYQVVPGSYVYMSPADEDTIEPPNWAKIQKGL